MNIGIDVKNLTPEAREQLASKIRAQDLAGMTGKQIDRWLDKLLMEFFPVQMKELQGIRAATRDLNKAVRDARRAQRLASETPETES